MSEPFVGEIKLFGFGYPPKGWALCDGSLLPINQNQALFSIIGVSYGGDGRSTFALPDLRGRVAVHRNGSSVPSIGASGGEAGHMLTVQEMPAHYHPVSASIETADTKVAAGGTWADTGTEVLAYGAQSDTQMSAQALGNAGGSAAHNNMQPYLVLNYCIALSGIFPSRN